MLIKLVFIKDNPYLYVLNLMLMTDMTPAAITDTSAANNNIQRLLSQDKITPQDIEHFTRDERHSLGATATQMLARLQGAERDAFINKIEPIMNPDTKNGVWEHNHAVITDAIAAYMQRHGIMPTRNTIAETTGLSRQTVAKHFKEYHAHPDFTARAEQFKFMSQSILAKVFKFACNGDVRAARLYFEMVGAINGRSASAVVNQQNNYIQINNTILSQENLDKLSAEQLAQIERIIRG